MFKRLTIKVLGLMIIVFIVNIGNAFALNYYGGSYDGYDVKLGANTDMVSISSAANQTFTFGDSATVISAITVTVDAGQITAANDIRVKIPADLDMTWDTTVTTATITGTASAKVSTAVTYEGSGKTLVLDVITNFGGGDSIIVSNLFFKDFNSPGLDYSNLTLSIDGGAVIAATDDKKKIINGIFTPFTGGSYDGYDVKLGANTDMVSISSAADQTFTFGDSATVISPITVTLDAGQITTANDIRIKIPVFLDMTWDTTVVTATITGAASAKVSTVVTYEGSGKTLVLDVITNFGGGDSIIVSNLFFKDFNSPGLDYSNLTLSIDGGAVIAATDDKKKIINGIFTPFTGGSYDGYAFGWNSDDAEAELGFFLSFE